MSTAHTFKTAGELQLKCVGHSVRLRGVTVRAVRSGDVQVVKPG